MRRGQALVEYALALAGITLVVALLVGLVGLTVRYAGRTENLVSSEYP
ncbi:MAG: hypothetical protein K6G91_13790 [Kiritimatiellae bacterium]|nr:hypothetical protein [Kiritimatiellia bacterium]